MALKEFRLVDTNQYPMKIAGAGKRFWHLCTVESSSGLRQFIHYVDMKTANVADGTGLYLEECTHGLNDDSVIRDDQLWKDLQAFLLERGLTGDKMMHFIEAKRAELGYGEKENKIILPH